LVLIILTLAETTKNQQNGQERRVSDLCNPLLLFMP